MRFTTIALPTLVIVAVIGAFEAGHYIGKADAERKAEAAAKLLGADSSAQVFMLASFVHKFISAGDIAQADVVAIRFAALQVPALAECALSKSCTAWIGQRLPTKLEMEAMVAAEASQRAGKK